MAEASVARRTFSITPAPRCPRSISQISRVTGITYVFPVRFPRTFSPTHVRFPLPRGAGRARAHEARARRLYARFVENMAHHRLTLFLTKHESRVIIVCMRCALCNIYAHARCHHARMSCGGPGETLSALSRLSHSQTRHRFSGRLCSRRARCSCDLTPISSRCRSP